MQARELADGLRARQTEIMQAVFARVCSIADPDEVTDPRYGEGLRASVEAAVQHGLEGIHPGVGSPNPVPPLLLTQACLAAQNGVGLDTVLRRYFAGYFLFADFLIEEAQRASVDRLEIKHLLQTQAALFDRILVAVSAEYTRESGKRSSRTSERRAEAVSRLLDGELFDASDLSYDFNRFHIGLVAAGAGAHEALEAATASFDAQRLLVAPADDAAWLWLVSRLSLDVSQLTQRISESWPATVALGVGESVLGLVGWRISHRQAAVALRVPRRGKPGIARYADVALLASALGDDLLATSLHQLYIAPLEEERDGGEITRRTLRSYLDGGHSVSSAAATLGVKRHTVTNRLRSVEERIGCSISMCASQIDLAIRLSELD